MSLAWHRFLSGHDARSRSRDDPGRARMAWRGQICVRSYSHDPATSLTWKVWNRFDLSGPHASVLTHAPHSIHSVGAVAYSIRDEDGGASPTRESISSRVWNVASQRTEISEHYLADFLARSASRYAGERVEQ
jgi:hypothetical protein